MLTIISNSYNALIAILVALKNQTTTLEVNAQSAKSGIVCDISYAICLNINHYYGVPKVKLQYNSSIWVCKL